MRRPHGRVVVLAAIAALLLASPSPVSAHGGAEPPASATAAVTPAVSGVSAVANESGAVAISAPGREVVVLGLYNEPFLQLRPDGSTWENLRSRTRYEMPAAGYTVQPPPEALSFNPAADAPVWVPQALAAGDGTLRWFDIRATAVDGHDHSAATVEAAAPMAVDVAVLPDPRSGYNISVLTEGFTWAPQNASREDVMGEGHAHLYVDGEKVGRLYGPHHHIDLDPGRLEVRVSLHTNAHSAYSSGGAPVVSSVVLDVPQRAGTKPPGEPRDHDAHEHSGSSAAWGIPLTIDGSPALLEGGGDPTPASAGGDGDLPWPLIAVLLLALPALVSVAVLLLLRRPRVPAVGADPDE